MRTAVTGKGKVSEHYLSPFFSYLLEKFSWLANNYVFLAVKKGRNRHSWLGK